MDLGGNNLAKSHLSYFLQRLNLSYSCLYGVIPYISQLTISNNPSICPSDLNVCATPLAKQYTGNRPTFDTQADEYEKPDNRDTSVCFAIAVMFGLAVELWPM